MDSTAAAPELTTDSVRSAAAYAESWLEFRQRYQRIPGVQAAVLHAGEIVSSVAFGHADVEQHVPLTVDHVFRIASHSKTFTATAVFQLVEAGRLRLDDRIGAHLDWLEPVAPGIAGRTVRELLGHGSGVIRDGRAADYWALMTPFPDTAAFRALVAADADVLEPNVKFKYSNVGYTLLGMVVEAAAGASYHEVVKAQIIDRLGLSATATDLPAERRGRLATGYSALSYATDRHPIDDVEAGAMAAATGCTSTAADLCRYAGAHVLGDDRLLTDASKRLMQRDEWTVDGPADRYGLGLGVTTVGDRRLLGHGGGYPGHSTRTLFDPEAGLAVSVLTNAIDGAAGGLVDAVFGLIDLAAAPDGHGPTHAAADVERFCGRYANLWGVLDIACLGGRLYGIDPSGASPAEHPTRLAVDGPDTLLITEAVGHGWPGERAVFDFAPDGAVRSVRVGGVTTYPIADYSARLAATDRVRAG